MNLLHFEMNEFDSPDIKGSSSMMKEDFLNLLDDARGIAGVPFVITSGYRTPAHNKEVGGVWDSAHTKGRAADISVSSGSQRWLIIDALIKVGFNRIGISHNFIHVDNDPSKPENVIWTY